MVWGWASGGAEVLLGQPAVTQRLVTGAAHGRGEGHRALQGTVLLAATSTRQDYGTTTRPVRPRLEESQRSVTLYSYLT